MSNIPIRNMQGETVGDYTLPDELLEQKKGEHAVYEAVVAHLAALRSGTASTKGKGEVAGSNKKPWRQKGTGMARAGYRQSPVWRGGSVAFGPKPRDYRRPLNKKTARLAFRRAFSDKVASGQVMILDAWTMEEPRTRSVADFLAQVDAVRGAVLVLGSLHKNALLATRNLPDVEVTTAGQLNTYTLLRTPVLIVEKEAMKALEARLGDAAGRRKP